QEIYMDLAGPIRGYVRSRGSKDPEDLASEVFLQVARNIAKFEGDAESFRSWVFVIAHRRLIDERRAKQRRPVITDDPVDPTGGNVEEEAIDQIGLNRVNEAMSHLTDDQREVLALRVIADLSLAETAKVLDKEIGAVKALQRRAVFALRRLVDEGRVSL
ncbi:MAG: sigma-70 family RNA polymerase sigma factor, partial [Actinomycetota bacterium]|nr:sigma-70 family RNA polymerase sigma factor [Actinomycetota bacterium]